MKGWSEELPALLRQVGSRDAAVEHKRVNFGVNTYLVPSLNDRDLQFSLPVLVRRDILSEFPYNPLGSDGAVAAVIEWIKRAVRRTSGLHAIAGAKTPVPGCHDANIEPCTIVHSPSQIGSGLWKADHLNFCNSSGLHLTLRGALPYAPARDPCEVRRVEEEIDFLLHALGDVVGQVPDRIIEHEWLASIDQKLVRDLLPERGLVCFISDGTRPAHGIT
jgi:predicted ABC-class ATPase